MQLDHQEFSWRFIRHPSGVKKGFIQLFYMLPNTRGQTFMCDKGAALLYSGFDFLQSHTAVKLSIKMTEHLCASTLKWCAGVYRERYLTHYEVSGV